MMMKEILICIIVLLVFIVGFDFGQIKTSNGAPPPPQAQFQAQFQPKVPQIHAKIVRELPPAPPLPNWYTSTPLGGDVFAASDAAIIRQKYSNFEKYTPKCPYGNGYREIGNVSSNNRVFLLCAMPDEIQSMEDLYRSYYKYLVIDQNRLPIYLNSTSNELTQGQNIQIPGYDGNFKVNLTQQDPRIILPY